MVFLSFHQNPGSILRKKHFFTRENRFLGTNRCKRDEAKNFRKTVSAACT